VPELSKEVVSLLQFLLPGFLVSWVFHSLSSHPRPAQLERIIQALIFTLFVQAAVAIERSLLILAGNWVRLGRWTSDSDLFASIISALLIGAIAAHLINKDTLHRCLRSRGFSTRSSHPSEWCTALVTYPRFVILNLKDGRRLYGWPEIWPSNSEKGHFFVTNAAWLDEGEPVDLPSIEGILVSVADVEFVEFIKEPEKP